MFLVSRVIFVRNRQQRYLEYKDTLHITNKPAAAHCIYYWLETIKSGNVITCICLKLESGNFDIDMNIIPKMHFDLFVS